MPGKHVATLDGVRGVAILAVMLCHFTLIRSQNPLGNFAIQLAQAGWWGVDLFFVLSGFLITSILRSTRSEEAYFLKFYARRALRIFPPYYAILLLFFVILPRIAPARFTGTDQPFSDQIWHWLYLTNWRIAWQGHNWSQLIPNVFWSLCVEEQFYLIWPAVVLLLGWRSLLGACMALFAGACILRPALLYLTGNPETVFVLTPTRMDGLLLGAALALLSERPGLIQVRAAAIAGCIAASGLALIFLKLGNLDHHAAAVQILGYPLLAAAFTSVLAMLIAAPQSWLALVMSTPLLRATGRWSYVMYLIHGPVFSTVRSVLYPGLHYGETTTGTLGQQMAIYAAAFAMTYLAAIVSWYGFERPILNLKRFVAY
jgi:peptidoglycan/LPS O-acetylase OafA/YrhL